MPTINTRQPRIRAQRLHSTETGMRVRLYWNGQRMPNGDGKPSGLGFGTADTLLTDYLIWWPAGQMCTYGGGFLLGGFMEDGATPTMGQGFMESGFLDGEFMAPGGYFEWTVPFVLRDGDYTFGMRLTDSLGNEQTGIDNVISFTVAALPRPPSNGRMVSYAGGNLNLAWDASPDIEP